MNNMRKEKQYRYSEIFKSIQGEGHHTGKTTLWYRAWGCNLECNGFGQKDPSDPTSWVLPYKDYDLVDVKHVEDLPVWTYGCDSSYTWSKRYRSLAHKDTATGIVDKIETLMTNKFNPNGRFCHPQGVEQHMAFTGGEPMMSQHAMLGILAEFEKRNNFPRYITIETNGTQQIKHDMYREVNRHNIREVIDGKDTEWFWSVSPKLSASGEKWEDAIKPDVVAAYRTASNHGQLKFVVDGTDTCWEEVEEATNVFREAGIDWPVWIMPVGATLEEQQDIAAKIAEDAMDRGYHVAARVHCYIWGNKIGT